MHDNTLDNPFWQFACTVYRQAPVANTLLQLQDDHGLNVIMLLLMLWLGQQGKAVDAAQLDFLQQAIAGIDRDIIRPLRQLRRHVKILPGAHESQYGRLKQLELDFEQEVMALLYQHCLALNIAPHETSCSERNLCLYAKPVSDAENRLLATLLAALV